MASITQLELYTSDIAAATKTLADYCREASIPPSEGTSPHLSIPPDAPSEVIRARQNILATVSRLQTLLSEPADLIQRLATQSQIIACLQWLGEFQVLACIPLIGSVLTKDVADLAGVPEMQLARIVRLTATAGFLHEPQPGYIAHTALSAPFVTKLSYLDAAMFLAETAVPSALQMAAATRRQEQLGRLSESAYNVAFNTPQTFQQACEQRAKLQRQWPAYLRCAGDMDDSLAELLNRLDWQSLGNACIVDVDAHSTATANALADLYPSLHFIVQMADPAQAMNGKELSPRITIQQRAPGTVQAVKDAAVYILGLRSPLMGMPSHSLPLTILSELRAHLGVLRANTSATLVLAPRLLPEPGTVDPDVEATARLRDLSLLQLANEREMELVELVDMVNSLHDASGRLVVVNNLRSRNSSTIALGIKYQPYGDGQLEADAIAV